MLPGMEESWPQLGEHELRSAELLGRGTPYARRRWSLDLENLENDYRFSCDLLTVIISEEFIQANLARPGHH